MKRLWIGFFAVTILVLINYATVTGQNPPPGYTGPIAQRPEWKVGDTWEYDEKRGWKLEELYHLVLRVIEVKSNEIVVKEEGGKYGELVRYYTQDLNWFKITPEVEPISRVEPDWQIFNWPLWVGKDWSPKVKEYPRNSSYPMHFKIEAFERMKLASGLEVEVFKISMWVEPYYPDPKFKYTQWKWWYAPALKNIVRIEADSFGFGKISRVLTSSNVTPTAKEVQSK